jgi:hypothetical protein
MKGADLASCDARFRLERRASGLRQALARQLTADLAAFDMADGDSPDARDELENLPPVVARLVVEVRSDGSRTIARGGLEDLTTGQRVTIEARGDSPAMLALALARSMLKLPGLVRKKVRGLLR